MKRSRAAEADAGPSEQSRFSRLDQATLDYYREIGECLHRLDGGEEKTLLADNTLAETHGREAQIAPDAACSRVLETALTHASASSIATFLNGCIMEDNLGIICTRYVVPESWLEVRERRSPSAASPCLAPYGPRTDNFFYCPAYAADLLGPTFWKSHSLLLPTWPR